MRVDFGNASAPVVAAPVESSFDANDPRDRALVRWMQDDLTNERPFSNIPGCPDEAWVLDRLRAWKADGTIRRVGAFVQHRRMGYAFNGMTVLDVSPDALDDLGSQLSELSFVSHCYARRRAEEWPYNLYAMVHAKTQEELDERVSIVQSLTGAEPRVLISTKEYKKASPTYFG